MNNIYQQEFYASEQIDANNLETTLVLDKGTLIVDKTQLQFTIKIPNFRVSKTNAADNVYTRNDIAHGSELKFYVIKDRPLNSLRQTLVTVDSIDVLTCDDIRPLQSTHYANKYRQDELKMNDYAVAEQNIGSDLPFIQDILDITNYNAANCTTMNFSVPLSDFLPFVFQSNEINILDNMEITLNFANLLLFFISGVGENIAGVASNHRFLVNPTFGIVNAADNNDSFLQIQNNLTLDIKINSLYRVQPSPYQTILNQTKYNQFKNKNVQSNMKIEDSDFSEYQSFCLFDDSIAMWLENIIAYDRLKTNTGSLQIMKNNRQLVNNEEIASYTGKRAQRYIIDLLNASNENNTQNCKVFGEFTKQFHSNRLFEYRLYLNTVGDTAPQFNLYINYVKNPNE